MTAVKAMVRQKNPKRGECEKSKTVVKKKPHKVTVPIFTKLLMIRIVASRRDESFIRSVIIRSAFILPSLTTRISFGPIEKKAISEADIYPEMSNKNAETIRAMIAPRVNGCKVTSPVRSDRKLSGSKYSIIS